jgi:hypothetical protein
MLAAFHLKGSIEFFPQLLHRLMPASLPNRQAAIPRASTYQINQEVFSLFLIVCALRHAAD